MSRPRCYVVDDEELSLASLVRMLNDVGRVEVAGSATDPGKAVEEIRVVEPDVLFLDIHMPELDGFQLLAEVPRQPLAIFTTAYDQHALRAFEVNSVDYLMKPISRERLLNALDKLDMRLVTQPDQPKLDHLLAELTRTLKPAGWLKRIASQSGESASLIDVAEVTHFVSEDRYTYACTSQGRFMLRLSLGDLESRLDPSQFQRIHRSAIVNLDFVDRMSRWFAGKLRVRLRDKDGTELTVSRHKVKGLREALGL